VWGFAIDARSTLMPTPSGWTSTSPSLPSGQPRTDALLANAHWDTGVVRYSFPGITASWSEDPGNGYGSVGGEGEPWLAGYAGLGPDQQAAARAAFSAWDAVTALALVEVVDSARHVGDIRLAFVSEELGGSTQAYAFYPAETAWAGDVWFNAGGSSLTEPWTPGSYEYLAALHEIGHALGLKHPFEQVADNPALLPDRLDTRSYTLMSYSAVAGQAGTMFNVEPTSPMLFDIAAIQALYGVDTRHNAGDTVYRFVDGQALHETLWDAGGTDTLLYRGSQAVTIDLRAGLHGSFVGPAVFATDRFGRPQDPVPNLWIAFGTSIEKAGGGSGADRLTGNAAANALRGNAGNDWLHGLGGDDTVHGGPGRDRLFGGTGDDRLDGGNGRDWLTGGAGVDAFVFSTGLATADNLDTLTDFRPGEDRLELAHAVFEALAPGQDPGSALRSGPGLDAAVDPADRLLYDSTGGWLYYDPDGNGTAPALAFARLGTLEHPVLSATDILVVA